MTDKELAKRMAELCEAFYDFCDAHQCDVCPMETFAHEGVCCHAWIWKRLRAETCGKQDWCPAAQKEDAATADKMEAVKLPKWCKVGQWVMDKQGNICEITRLGYPHKAVRVCIPKDGGRSLSFEGRWLEEIVPVKFRTYSYGEAKVLIGKVMEFSCGDAVEAELISRVYRNSPSEEVTINGSRVDWLAKECNATIDGVPIGVPEMDEEAMKEGEE